MKIHFQKQKKLYQKQINRCPPMIWLQKKMPNQPSDLITDKLRNNLDAETSTLHPFEWKLVVKNILFCFVVPTINTYTHTTNFL